MATNMTKENSKKVKNKALVQMQIRLPVWLIERLDEESESLGINRTEVIRQALSAAFEISDAFNDDVLERFLDSPLISKLGERLANEFHNHLK